MDLAFYIYLTLKKKNYPYAQKNDNNMFNGPGAIFMYFDEQSSR